MPALPSSCRVTCAAPDPGRRLALRRVATGAAGAIVLQLGFFTGCGPGEREAPPFVTVPLADLPEGRRVVVKVGTTPVELRRVGDEVIALSLLCTHQGCVVAWQQDIQQYKCPCQGAWFDEMGDVIAGPTTKPLLRFPVTRQGDGVHVTMPEGL